MNYFLKLCFIISLIFLSCSAREKNNKPPSSIVINNHCDTCIFKLCDYRVYGWFSEIDTCGNMILYRGKLTDSIIDIDDAIKKLNATNPVNVKYIDKKNDTLCVQIINSQVYTQQLGTTGSTQYMLELLYTLTDHFGIKYVDVKFEEGDHGGQPGIYNRNKTGVGLPKRVCSCR